MHHDEDYLRTNINDEIALVWSTLKIADNMVNNIRRGYDLTDWERIKDMAFESLGITELDYFDLLEDRSEQLNVV